MSYACSKVVLFSADRTRGLFPACAPKAQRRAGPQNSASPYCASGNDATQNPASAAARTTTLLQRELPCQSATTDADPVEPATVGDRHNLPTWTSFGRCCRGRVGRSPTARMPPGSASRASWSPARTGCRGVSPPAVLRPRPRRGRLEPRPVVHPHQPLPVTFPPVVRVVPMNASISNTRHSRQGGEATVAVL